MSTKKTKYGLKAFGVGYYVKEIIFEQPTVTPGNWSEQTDQIPDYWAKQNTTQKVWNGTNG